MRTSAVSDQKGNLISALNPRLYILYLLIFKKHVTAQNMLLDVNRSTVLV